MHSEIFISPINLYTYQKSYHLVEPFLNLDFFQSASARCKMVKVFLYPRTFSRKCLYCSLEFKDILSHHIFSCKNVEKYTRLLRSKLRLYNFPADKLREDNNFLGTVLDEMLYRIPCRCRLRK